MSQRARPDVKRARPSDHGDARASRPSRAYSVARAGERAARASRRPDRSPETRAPRCRHAGCARRRQDSSSQRRSPRALRLRGRRARRRRGSRSPRAPRGVHRHGLGARAHTQDGPRRLRPRALRPGKLRPLPPPPGRNPYSLSEFTLFWPTHLGFALAAAPPFGRMRRPTRTDAVMEGPRVDVFEPTRVAFGNNTRLGPRVARFPPRIPPRTKSATTTFVPWNSRLTSQKKTLESRIGTLATLTPF